MKKVSYGCAQPDLYLACRNGWWLCQKHLAAFAAVKPKYTEGYIQESLDAIDITDLLPDVNARYTEYDLVRMSLLKCNADIINQFMLLLGYIDDAYASEERDIMYRSAGNAFLAKSKTNNWASMAGLLSAAVPFLVKYQETLETTVKTPSVKNNMPAIFTEKFKGLASIFNGLYKGYKESDGEGMDKTSEKVEANNVIYKDLISMFDDAKRIFNDTPELKNEFTFPNMLSKVRGNKPAGIAGKVTEADKKTVIDKVTITIKGTDKVASCNDKGRYEITSVTASKYTLVAEAEGFEPAVSEEVTIKSGIMSRVNFIMVPKELLKSVA